MQAIEMIAGPWARYHAHRQEAALLSVYSYQLGVAQGIYGVDEECDTGSLLAAASTANSAGCCMVVRRRTPCCAEHVLLCELSQDERNGFDPSIR